MQSNLLFIVLLFVAFLGLANAQDDCVFDDNEASSLSEGNLFRRQDD
jgi:hypothetical protein